MRISDQFSNMVRTALALAYCVAGMAQTPPGRPPLTSEQLEQMRKAQEERLHSDWADLKRYRDQDANLAAPAADENRVVFLGGLYHRRLDSRSSRFFPGSSILRPRHQRANNAADARAFPSGCHQPAS
jgi:hypothetical protein